MTLVEVGLAMSILTLVVAGFSIMLNDFSDRRRVDSTATQMKTVREAAQKYMKAQVEHLLADVPVGTGSAAHQIQIGRASASSTAPAGSLQALGYLPLTYVDVNAYGQSHVLLVRQPEKGRLEALVSSYGGRDIPDVDLGMISAGIGSEGGFMSARVGTITGTGGGWAAAPSDWNAGAFTPMKGHAMASMALEQGTIVADYLYRRDIGIPEANRMRTDMSMGEHDINDVASITTTVNGAKSIDFAETSYLTITNLKSRLRLGVGPDGVGTAIFGGDDPSDVNDVVVGRDVKVDRDASVAGNAKAGVDVTAGASVSAGRDVSAGRNLKAGTDVLATGNVTAGRDVTATRNVSATKDLTAGQDVVAGRNVKGRKFFDTDKGEAYYADPSDKTKFFDLSTYQLDLRSSVYGQTHAPLRPAETLGGAVSRLWNCRLEYNGGGGWASTPLLDGTSGTGGNVQCSGVGCSIQMRTVCN